MLLALSTNEIVALVALGVFALVGLVVGLFLLVGLFNARSLLRREFSAYFLSPIAYVMLAVFLGVTGCRFYLTLDQLTKAGPGGVEFPMQFLFSILPRGVEGSGVWLLELLSGVAFWLVYVLIPPLLTMRLFAEERSTGTLEVLMTTPLRDWQVVLCKYLACFGFYLMLWLPTLAYLPILLNLQQPSWHPELLWDPEWTLGSILLGGGLAAIVLAVLTLLLPFGTTWRIISLVLLFAGLVSTGLGVWRHCVFDPIQVFQVTAKIDPMPVLGAYLGLILAGAMFLALGILVSSLVRSQVVAALLTVTLSLVAIVAGLWPRDMDTGSSFARVLYSFSVPLHISQDFGRGLIDTRHLVLYGSVTLFCLFLTVRSLESRRWRS
jgi:ABC-type transport system involved in multi-copper enzyme maturation permease subunit